MTIKNDFLTSLLPLLAPEGNEGGEGAAATDNADTGEAGAAGEPTDNNGAGEVLTTETVQKMIQAETDRVRTEYTKRIRAVEEEKENLLKEKMSESEKKDFELSKREKAIREAEEKLLNSNIEIAASEHLAAMDMPQSFKKFVKGASVENTKELVTELNDLWKEALEAEVQKRFAANGRVIPKSQQAASNMTNESVNNLIRNAARR